MKLSEVFTQLAYGELSQLAVVNEDGDGIATTKQGQIVAHVNLGLAALYKRFLLKEGRVSIQLVQGVSTYPLNSESDTVFIESVDSPEFLNDVFKVERVYTEGGVEFSLNDESDPYSCTTPSLNTLKIPYTVVNQTEGLPEDLKTSTVDVVYRANHPKIVYTGANFNPARVEVELPMSHLEALLLYVASRVNNPIGMVNEFNAGNNFYAKYEKACMDLEIQNIRVDQGKQSNRLVSNGWV
jgi:hypothetical protein